MGEDRADPRHESYYISQKKHQNCKGSERQPFGERGIDRFTVRQEGSGMASRILFDFLTTVRIRLWLLLASAFELCSVNLITSWCKNASNIKSVTQHILTVFH